VKQFFPTTAEKYSLEKRVGLLHLKRLEIKQKQTDQTKSKNPYFASPFGLT
jgi:hypothetical protein